MWPSIQRCVYKDGKQYPRKEVIQISASNVSIETLEKLTKTMNTKLMKIIEFQRANINM